MKALIEIEIPGEEHTPEDIHDWVFRSISNDAALGPLPWTVNLVGEKSRKPAVMKIPLEVEVISNEWMITKDDVLDALRSGLVQHLPLGVDHWVLTDLTEEAKEAAAFNLAMEDIANSREPEVCL